MIELDRKSSGQTALQADYEETVRSFIVTDSGMRPLSGRSTSTGT